VSVVRGAGDLDSPDPRLEELEENDDDVDDDGVVVVVVDDDDDDDEEEEEEEDKTETEMGVEGVGMARTMGDDDIGMIADVADVADAADVDAPELAKEDEDVTKLFLDDGVEEEVNEIDDKDDGDEDECGDEDEDEDDFGVIILVLEDEDGDESDVAIL
jgi:hypothetical protein